LDSRTYPNDKIIRHLNVTVAEKAGTSTSLDWARVRKQGNILGAVSAEEYNLPLPIITTINPINEGCEGSPITITGSNFNSKFGTEVTIGGVPVQDISVNGAGTVITGTIGQGLTGKVVINAGGRTVSSVNDFIVLLMHTVNEGPALPDICQGGV